MTAPELNKRMANAIRALAMDSVEKAKSGHPGMPMGMADVATVLFTRFLKFDVANPHWPDRDRFVLSAGHGSMLLYSVLHLLGSTALTIGQLKQFRQLHSLTPGHPENFVTPGIETTTGPLGQGLAMSVGFALAERMLNAEYGDDIVDHYTYVIAGDGCLMEGVSHEAIDLAGHLKLNKLIVLFDDNGITIDGHTDLSTSVDQVARFQASGWHAERVDGFDQEEVAAAIERARKSDKPSLIACKTIIGYGAPTKADSHASHGAALGAAEIAGAREKLGWPYPPFEIPDDVATGWLEAGKGWVAEREAWEARLAAKDHDLKAEFKRRFDKILPGNFEAAVEAYKRGLSDTKPKVATRKSSEMALDMLTAIVPELVGGSADLTGSNLTRGKPQKPLTPEDYSGRYIHYGIREFGMSAAMNGISLHGGFLPYGGTFLVFSDYARPAIRLSALMGTHVVYVMTHDSIGLGEDGPTHQPVEHLAALRAIPHLLVFRPADAVEVAECWQIALETTNHPSLLALSRQNLPVLRTAHSVENKSARGAYLIAGPADAEVTLFATGSEVEIAVNAMAKIEAAGRTARVVSVPSFELFAAQDAAYRAEVIGTAKVKVAIEAAIRQGWDTFIGHDGIFIGMTGFGASAPIEALYPYFGITADAAADAALARLTSNV
ncbi:transketolase [Kaistia dalseonensis]|uniref:Transketolase n=1 Tax=Kaistia dalseonensis TaxID=410840 RepID=A0ABU0HB19_9HYPH|nr:transketolase [Kaistia dalseonensis]MCX5496560.1 transketolase [Kaistia dalseonensis]MDQ0439182.1 transketolase [Kaistia dalseonensis]